MAHRWRWVFVLAALFLSGGQLFAAGTKEQRAYTAALNAFQDEMWSRAETELAQFIQKYPKSTNAPEAVLRLAQSEFCLGKFPAAIARLADNNNLARAKASGLADQYVYWIGEAQYASRNFPAAAQTFVALVRDFPRSSLRLQSAVAAAAAYAGLEQWPQVDAVLQETNGVFQRAAHLDPASELVTRGRLLLAQAAFEQNHPGTAAATLASINPQALEPELGWQLAYQTYQVKLALGDTNAALAATTNMLQITRQANEATRRGESVALHAGLLEQAGWTADALEAYRENLINAPPERQQQAVLKIAELAASLGRFVPAEDALRNFITQYTNSPATDIALLSLGELYLTNYVVQSSATNYLTEAQNYFDRLLAAFPNGPLAGKAHLDQGWCLWLQGKIPESYASFKAATGHPLSPEDLAVARFKMGDALFAQNDFTRALENYRAVVDEFDEVPAVKQNLGDRALYQCLQACLALTNSVEAEGVMARILRQYPAAAETGNGLLLMGEYYADLRQPTNALAAFQQFEALFPHSPLRPQVELAMAHTYGLAQGWMVAVEKYEKWLVDFPTNGLLRPRAEYALAWANYQAGNETNAYIGFTNFVAQFPTNDLAPRAQMWVADHFFRAGDYQDAEKNYKFIFQNFLPNDLTYPAYMMAGRAAVARQGYSDALSYFSKLAADTNCDIQLRFQATFAHGAALMLMDSTDTNNPLANFQLATNDFSQVCLLNPTNELGAMAWIEIGKCNLQLTNYDAATNACAQVVNSPFADIAARSQAQIGLGLALEKKADAAAVGDQSALRELALQNFLNVFYENNLRDDEQADEFWTREAGLQALPLIEALGESPPGDFFNRMERWLPQLKEMLEKARSALSASKS